MKLEALFYAACCGLMAVCLLGCEARGDGVRILDTTSQSLVREWIHDTFGSNPSRIKTWYEEKPIVFKHWRLGPGPSYDRIDKFVISETITGMRVKWEYYARGEWHQRDSFFTFTDGSVGRAVEWTNSFDQKSKGDRSQYDCYFWSVYDGSS